MSTDKAPPGTAPNPDANAVPDSDEILAGMQHAARAGIAALHERGLPAHTFRNGNVVPIPPPLKK